MSTVNVAVAAVNRFTEYMQMPHLHMKRLKKQRSTFRSEERDLSMEEFKWLLETAESQGKERLARAIETIYSLGLRVSELQFVTVEAVNSSRHEVVVRNKGKIRTVIITGKLLQKLKKYCSRHRIKSGPVFISRTGKPVSRTQIWSEMKKLCEAAGVESTKVFPHNLRHLFAVTYYRNHRDIARLADILGHSSVNTTRIYLMRSIKELRREMEEVQFELPDLAS